MKGIGEEADAPERQSIDSERKKVLFTRLVVELIILVVALGAVCVVGESRNVRWWCLLRASCGSVEMQFKLAESYADSDDFADIREAVKWYTRAAESGHMEAARKLADLCNDPEERRHWLTVAAERGDAEASYQLSRICAAESDPAKEIEYLTRSAKGGFPTAQHALGTRYLDGLGVPQDRDKAVEWYKKSALQGNYVSEARLRKLGVKLDY